MSVIMRHADHDPALICRPAGNGLCEPLRSTSREPLDVPDQDRSDYPDGG